ncbi:MAG: glycosyltransferase family 8 protein [Puniceicoccales bacterium]|jgi:lipopolysaccharide biosynthesis glycosyltransferase|nr:glycosyltransferase family 8 protein [Puniceicoccales bacterium]
MKQDSSQPLPCPSVEDISIFMAFNDAYAPHASVAIASILMNSESALHFFILHRDISLETQRRIMELRKLRHFEMDFIEVNADLFHGLPTVPHITIECYFRLMIPWLNPVINKALFMDSDIVVLDDVKDIWNFDIENVYAAVVEDVNSGALKDIKKYAHAFDKGHRYFNAGIMLLNLKNIRADFTLQKFMDIANRMKNVFKFADQDILNLAFARKLTYLPIKWNVTDAFMKKLRPPFSERKHEVRGVLQNPSLIHFTGSGKPWVFPFGTSSNPFACYYFHYLGKTDYSNTKLRLLSTCLKMTVWEFRYVWRHPLFFIRPAFWRAFFLRRAVGRKFRS